MTLKLNRKQLVELIEAMEAKGTDATALRQELAELEPEEKPSRKGRRDDDREETTEERLTRRVGDLFPEGIPYQEILDYDYRFSNRDLINQCREAGVGLSGDKKELAAKLIAHERGSEHKVKEGIMQDIINLNQQREWEGKPGEVAIPEAYLKDLLFEVVVFARKERGGSDFSFQCREYEERSAGEWHFSGVVIDTSKKDADGKVETVRVTYHPEVTLINVGCMIIPAGEDAGLSSR